MIFFGVFFAEAGFAFLATCGCFFTGPLLFSAPSAATIFSPFIFSFLDFGDESFGGGTSWSISNTALRKSGSPRSAESCFRKLAAPSRKA